MYKNFVMQYFRCMYTRSGKFRRCNLCAVNQIGLVRSFFFSQYSFGIVCKQWESMKKARNNKVHVLVVANFNAAQRG